MPQCQGSHSDSLTMSQGFATWSRPCYNKMQQAQALQSYAVKVLVLAPTGPEAGLAMLLQSTTERIMCCSPL